MLHHWYLHADTMNISIVLMLDYFKAFDLVDINILVKKLYKYYVPDILIHFVIVINDLQAMGLLHK